MKKLYFLDEDEKNRILNLHESATKKQYLKEDDTMVPELDEADGGAVMTGLLLGGVVGAAAVMIKGAGGSYAGVSKIFQACKTKGMGKSTMAGGTLDQIADEIYNSVDGAGTDEDMLKAALSKIATVPDLCAVNKRYAQNYPGSDLFGDLDGDIDSDGEWNKYVYRPLLNAVRKTEELSAKSNAQSTQKFQFPCVTISGGKAAKLKDGSLAYVLNGETYYGNGRVSLANGTMSNYYCDGNNIKKGAKTNGQVKTNKTQVTKKSGVKTSTIPSDADLDAVLGKL